MTDLVHLLEPTHEAALQIQLIRDAEIERGVERLVVRLERRGCGAAVQRLQHRRFYFQIPLGIQESPNSLHDPRAQPEHVAHFGMHREIGVALPVAQLWIRQLAMLHTARVFLPER